MADLIPEVTVRTKSNDRTYTWEAYPEEQTGLRAIRCIDDATGVILTVTQAHPTVRVAAHKAWGGARYSRAPGSAIEILSEMGMKGVNPDEKLDSTFSGYGHQSVGDMAQIMVYADNVPNHVPFFAFYDGEINAGQEKSTRFQGGFDKFPIQPVQMYFPQALRETKDVELFADACNRLGALSLANFTDQREIIAAAYRKFYDPQTQQQEGAFTARVLDTARFMLVLGQNSGFAYQTTARDWSAKISRMQSMASPFYQRLGEHFKMLLSPAQTMEVDGTMHTLDNEKKSGHAWAVLEERLGYKAEAPSLIRHTEPNNTVRDNLRSLQQFIHSYQPELISRTSDAFAGQQPQTVMLIDEKYTTTERMVAQYLTAAFPALAPAQALNWTKTCDEETKKMLSRIIFCNHECNNVLPQLAATSSQSLIYTSQIGEIRDFNRHRAQGRHLQGLPMLWGLHTTASDMKQLFNSGYGLPLYLEMPEFKDVKKGFTAALENYYEELFALQEHGARVFGNEVDWTFMLNLTPMAQQLKLWMHSDPKQSAYFCDRRARNGGHINYRDLAYNAWELLRADPYQSAMPIKADKPDPASKEQFFSRS